MSNAKGYLILVRRDVAMVVFVAAIFILAVVYSVFSATTIGDNINTGGTLTASGASTLAAATFSGTVQASSTLQATGNTTLYGSTTIGVASSSPTVDFNVLGAAYITNGLGVGFATSGASGGVVGSGQLHVKGLAAFDNRVGVSGTSSPVVDLGVDGSAYVTGGLGVGFATTGAGAFQTTGAASVGGSLGVGTTSPYQSVGVQSGDVALASTATTTLSLESTTATVSGCIELKGGGADVSGAKWIRIYVGGTGATNTIAALPPAVIGAGGAGYLIVEPGRCQ